MVTTDYFTLAAIHLQEGDIVLFGDSDSPDQIALKGIVRKVSMAKAKTLRFGLKLSAPSVELVQASIYDPLKQITFDCYWKRDQQLYILRPARKQEY